MCMLRQGGTGRVTLLTRPSRGSRSKLCDLEAHVNIPKSTLGRHLKDCLSPARSHFPGGTATNGHYQHEPPPGEQIELIPSEVQG